MRVPPFGFDEIAIRVVVPDELQSRGCSISRLSVSRWVTIFRELRRVGVIVGFAGLSTELCLKFVTYLLSMSFASRVIR